jgi:hypothetical protein
MDAKLQRGLLSKCIRFIEPGVHYKNQLLAQIDDGNIYVGGDSLIVDKASMVTFFFMTATNLLGQRSFYCL